MSEQKSISLAEMQHAKAALQETISNALAQFTAQTGILVRGVNVQSMTITRDDEVVSGPRYRIGVEVRL